MKEGLHLRSRISSWAW